jgi:hypothetical protein
VSAPLTGIPLRGGAFTLDPRLDRLPHFDDRSRDWQIREVLARTVVPDRRSLAGRFWTPGPTLDQGEEGQCVSEAIHDARNGSPNRTRPTVELFEERRRVYHELQHLDPWAGCYLGARCPIAPDPANAYGGTSVLTGAQYGRRQGWWREFRWIGAGSDRLEDDLIDTLRTVGGIVFGIPWLEGMYETSPDGLVLAEGPEVGGHAIHGWEWAPRQRMPRHWKGTRPGVWWHNSWGPSYGVTRRGRTGCGFIPLDDVDGRLGILSLLERGGEGMVPLA